MKKRANQAFSTCIEGLTFDAVHYTPIDGKPTLHGHTFRVRACVSKESMDNMWVVDFDVLRKAVSETLSKFNYSILVRSEDSNTITLKGPFTVNLVELEFLPTAENIAFYICKELFRKLELGRDFEVSVWVEEGSGNVGVSRCSRD